MEKGIIAFFIGIFLITQALGLYVGNEYINLIKSGEVEQPQIFPGISPQSVENSVLLIIYVLAVTGVMIVLIRFKRVMIRGVEAIAIFFASWVTFTFLVPIEIFSIPVSIFLAIALTAWKMWKPSILNQNLAVIFSISGAGALMGVSLGILPVLAFVIMLSIYDFLSVFVTKHMVYIAKEISKTPTAFSAAFPYKFKKPTKTASEGKKSKGKFHIYQLGGGDIAIPLVFAVSVLSQFGIIQAIFSIIGAVSSLLLIIYYVSRNTGKALPALPWINAGMLIGFLISVIVF